jgi:hypothetical protein
MVSSAKCMDQRRRVGQHGDRPVAHISTVVFRRVNPYTRDRPRPNNVINLGQFGAFGQTPRALSAVQRSAVLPARPSGREARIDKPVEELTYGQPSIA